MLPGDADMASVTTQKKTALHADPSPSCWEEQFVACGWTLSKWPAVCPLLTRWREERRLWKYTHLH